MINPEPIPTDEPLPEGWAEVVSRSQGLTFYHNKATGETSWVRPRIDPPVEEVVSDRPITPPPTAPKASSNGTAGRAIASASKADQPTSTRQPPSGPGSARYPETDRAASVSVSAPASEKKAEPVRDPVQSAYASRKKIQAGREPARAPSVAAGEDRGVKRSMSPRREETKRSRVENNGPGRPEPAAARMFPHLPSSILPLSPILSEPSRAPCGTVRTIFVRVSPYIRSTRCRGHLRERINAYLDFFSM